MKHTRSSGLSVKHEREDRSMIAHAHDKCARCVLIFSDIIYSGHYLESLALFLWRVLQETVAVLGNSNCMYRVSSLIGEDCSIGGAICVCV